MNALEQLAPVPPLAVLDQIIHGDCLHVLAAMPANSVDLIVTSPPYADSRASSYGGVKPDGYVEWFLPIAEQLYRVLKEDGTFILNIKEQVVDGERHTYVLDLIHAMRAQGWLWTEEFIWHKRNCTPGKWPHRFRDAWERCLQFNKQRRFNMYQENVMVPVGAWKAVRMKHLSDIDKLRASSNTGSGFAKNVSNWEHRTQVYPTNVLYFATECGNTGHSAAFPRPLPSGSSSFSRGRETSFSTPSWVPVPRVVSPSNSVGDLLGLNYRSPTTTLPCRTSPRRRWTPCQHHSLLLSETMEPQVSTRMWTPRSLRIAL